MYDYGCPLTSSPASVAAHRPHTLPVRAPNHVAGQVRESPVSPTHGPAYLAVSPSTHLSPSSMGWTPGQTGDSHESITLPDRFERRRKAKCRQGWPNISISSLDCVYEQVENYTDDDHTQQHLGDVETHNTDWKSWEKDMELAIKWIKQEIVEMKDQDRALMRQLLELRAMIHQVRGLRTSQSGSDLTRWVSDVAVNGADLPHSCSDLWSYHNRAVSMMTVNQDNSPQHKSLKNKDNQSFHLLM